MVRSQTEARRFFVGKILGQARTEGVRLSEAERQMLSWSESDADYVADPELPWRLDSEISQDAYEKKIGGLLARSLAADEGADPSARDQWRRAYQTLDQGDHYILIIIGRSVGGRLKRWWQFWR